MRKVHHLTCVLLAAGVSNVAVASWAVALSDAGSLEATPAAQAAVPRQSPQSPQPPQTPPVSRASTTDVPSTRVEASAPSHAATFAPDTGRARGGYVARNDNLRVFFDALSPYLGRTVIVSKLAARKQVSGDFDMTNARAQLDSIATKLGLIWYHDGQSIYVYDASEIRNATVSLVHAGVSELVSYLRTTGLYDRRYPIRGDAHSRLFYVSGPPVFVDLVIAAARSIDRRVSDGPVSGPDQIGVVRMDNAFVSDRTYQLRDEKIVIPGMASVVTELVKSSTGGGGASGTLPATPLPRLSSSSPAPGEAHGGGLPPPLPPQLPLSPNADGSPVGTVDTPAERPAPPAGSLIVKAYPAGNSLLVRGTAEQVERVERLVSRLDRPRRHIELSLWIIDVRKEALDSLGVDWSGGVNIGSRLGLVLNATTPLSTLDGMRFLARIQAMASNGQATVVSRPVILTQENIPAVFDGSQTFYVPLEGERTTDLRSVTYGTMISVWPRFAGQGEIEMTLNIEDGTSTPKREGDGESKYTVLPTVSRTRISTIARVPQGKSLLIGGYTRDSGDTVEKKVPLLGDIPLLGRAFRYTSQARNNDVRVFLIQPREIAGPMERDASDIVADTMTALPGALSGVGRDVREATGLLPPQPPSNAVPASPVVPPVARDEPSTHDTGVDRDKS
ncbi:type III secretion system outer membrane ring subunit SctC [Pandoraea pnomenusa]|uniref:type III secretion system outer membrane ring subunit SctC n=1 Tax=Pandoraea pnomenusa TaxID=93220 RepID=UPI000A71505A|nr:type III secretion system outer membrane ring subunit SctC [Pandoraea pnomenusa]